MMADVDNSGAVDIANNWNMGGRTCHVALKQNFLVELKESDIIEYNRISMADESDMFTKNLAGPEFNKNMIKLCGHNEYH